MKFSLIAAVVVLALAQGSFAADMTDLEKLGQYLDDMKTKITQDLAEIVRSQDLATQAQTFIEERKTQIEPLAAQLQEQLKTIASSVEQQIKPLTADVQAQIEPMFQQFQQQVGELFQRVMSQAKALEQ